MWLLLLQHVAMLPQEELEPDVSATSCFESEPSDCVDQMGYPQTPANQCVLDDTTPRQCENV